MPALEKDFLARFRSKLKKLWPNGFIYKIPDTKGLGGMRPFDAICIISGHTFCLEAKRDNKSQPTEYQQYHLDLASKNGAHSFVINPDNEISVLVKMQEIINVRESSDSRCF